MARCALLLLCVLIALAGCMAGPDPARDLHGPDGLPARAASVPEAVDGLEIGHRLTAAGEYELALRAYHRAAAQQGPTVDVLSAIGSVNLRLGRVQQAEQDLRRALEQDERFVPALNNLGVVLAEQGKWAEASLHFRNAFSVDAGRSQEIRENLRLAVEKSERTDYPDLEVHQLSLMRRGHGRYLLLAAPL